MIEDLALNETLEQSSEGANLRHTSIRILSSIMKSEERFEKIMEIYQNMIKKGSRLTDDVRLNILSKNPEKKGDVRKALFEMLADSSEEVRKRVRDQIHKLRLKQNIAIN